MSGIVIGDVHASLKYMEIIENSFNFLFSTKYYKKSNFVVFQGDLFDHRKNIDVMVLEAMTNIFEKMVDKKIYIIMGNHDMYNKESKNISSLNALEKMFSNIEVIKEPVLKNIDGINLYMLPFNGIPKKENIKKSNYILGHLEIYPYFPKSEIKESLFKGKKVFMGHQHKFDPKNTLYSGSLFTTSYNEVDNQKYFLYLENEKDYTFFKNKADILHLSMRYKNEKIIIPFLKEEYDLLSLSKDSVNKKYKYILEGTEEEIEKVLKAFAEINVNIQIKTVVSDNEKKAEDIEYIDEKEIENILKNENSVFKIFQQEIKNDKIKQDLFEEAISLCSLTV